ncbi:MAG: hypothetical protein M1819_000032 [Sarea resinae]|nr:MAG: hypothetical protein M1819_000032 [Sarea resinae]
MQRLRAENEALMNENEALRAQLYGSPSASPLDAPSVSDLSQRSPSVSPGPSRRAKAEQGSPFTDPEMPRPGPTFPSSSPGLHPGPPVIGPPSPHSHFVARQDVLQQLTPLASSFNPFAPSSSLHIHPSRPSLPGSSQSISGEIDLSSLGFSHQQRQHQHQPRQQQQQQQSQRTTAALTPYNLSKFRDFLHEIFHDILVNPAVTTSPELHLTALSNLSRSLPVPLQPTVQQLGTPHHYTIDLVPSPTLRDRLIGLGTAGSFGFVTEVLGFFVDSAVDEGQIIIWGDNPLDETAWEMSVGVLGRWGWLVGREWVERANFWRRQRGAPPLPEW